MSDGTPEKITDENIVCDDEFVRLLTYRSADLLGVMNALSTSDSPTDLINRPLIGRILGQATQLVELLDRYGAQSNKRWHVYRLMAATVKRFADVSYEMHHVLSVLPSYRLLPIEQDFIAATKEALVLSDAVILRSGMEMLAEAKELSLPLPSPVLFGASGRSELPPGILPRDRPVHTEANVRQSVTLLATAFLNVASECKDVRSASRAKPEQYASFVPNAISEEKLRHLSHRLHNLQSLYDTWVSDTQTEDIDPNLSVLRGHISVVFHLLRIATSLIHYYERHIDAGGQSTQAPGTAMIDPAELLRTTMSYSILFSGVYLDAARTLCQDMLKSYAEICEIELPIPRYRGFHVRPSTLVAKIVLYYGSDVRMTLNGHSYDASTPLEIFRANETINARKRQWLASAIADHEFIKCDSGDAVDVMESARKIVLDLASHGKMMIYAQPLVMRDVPIRQGGTLLERVIDEVAHLQATGKIDMNVDITITFRGDKRVLDDLRLLAEYGYGEDNMGVDIVLPSQLDYLRR
jgi:hypothetical protein